MTRLGVWALRFRDWALWVLPILGFAVGMALLLTLAILFVTVAGQRDDQAETLRHVEKLAEEAKVASETSKAILEQIRPCVIGDPPDSPACVAQTARDQRIADAINAIAAQHDEVLARLERLIARPAAQKPPQAAPIPRSAPRATSSAPAAPSATTAAPVTTVCPERGKRPKECR